MIELRLGDASSDTRRTDARRIGGTRVLVNAEA